MDSNWAALLAAGVAIGLGAIGPGIGIGTAFAAGINSYARQPELKGSIFVWMLVGAALMEALAIYALVISLILLYGGFFAQQTH